MDVMGVIPNSLLKGQLGAPDISLVFGGIYEVGFALLLVHLELLMVICFEILASSVQRLKQECAQAELSSSAKPPHLMGQTSLSSWEVSSDSLCLSQASLSCHLPKLIVQVVQSADQLPLLCALGNRGVHHLVAASRMSL